jgi:glutamyl-tRNA synthetase
VSVLQYRDAGYLPEALVNYLARLGWSHGDDEIFSREQLVAWFDGEHLSRSAAQWDAAKLDWVNAQAMKASADDVLAALVSEQLQRRGVTAVADERLERMCGLFKDRCSTTVELAGWLAMYFVAPDPQPLAADPAAAAALEPALQSFADQLEQAEWSRAGIAAAVKATLAQHALKMPQFAPAVRLRVCGRAQTPSLDAVLELFPREVVLARLREAR